MLWQTGWSSRFLQVSVHVLAAVSSDHHPLLVDFQQKMGDCRSFMRGFKFEEGWKNDAAFLEIVRSAWEAEEDRGCLC